MAAPGHRLVLQRPGRSARQQQLQPATEFGVTRSRGPFWGDGGARTLLRAWGSLCAHPGVPTLLCFCEYSYTHAIIRIKWFTSVWGMSRDSSVGIATDHGQDGRGSNPDRVRSFSSPQRPDRLRGPTSLLSNGYRGLFPGVKRPGREADHSPPTSVEVKNGGSIPPLPHMCS
jgi:hypothetical protein